MEFFATFVSAYTVLAVATSGPLSSQVSKHKMYFALSIAFCVTAGGFAVGAISGGELNPAVGLGISTLGLASPEKSALPPLTHLVALSCMEIFGGVFAAVVFFSTHPKERDPTASEDVASVLC